jgi:hypothetical protein
MSPISFIVLLSLQESASTDTQPAVPHPVPVSNPLPPSSLPLHQPAVTPVVRLLNQPPALHQQQRPPVAPNVPPRNIQHQPPNVPALVLDAPAALQTCAICHRCSTQTHPVTYVLLTTDRAFNNALSIRHFGDRTGMSEGEQVCTMCCRYVCPHTATEHQTPAWRFAWPSVIWTCLTKAGYATARTFMLFLPYELRDHWIQGRHDWLPAMRDALNVPPVFRDRTAMLQTFRNRIASGQLQHLMQALNDTCFPQVRCPMGCFLYIDDEVGVRTQLLPASHYLATFIPNFTAFNAEANYFKGSRSDWTTPFWDLDWEVAPSLLVDNSCGLAILMCSSQKHSPGTTPYFHVPTHPLLSHTTPQTPDHLAPAVVTASVARCGRTNQYNTSFPVFEQRGNHGGLSTIRLATKSPHFVMTDEITVCSGFTLDQRPDILHYAIQSPNFESGAISDILDRYALAKPPPNIINACAEHSTFLDLEDAYVLTSAQNAYAGTSKDIIPQHQPNNDPQGDVPLAVNPADCLLIIHPNSLHGHRPFSIPRGHVTRAHPEPPMSWLLYANLQCLLHVRVLHTRLLHRVWANGNQPLHRRIVDCCKMYASNKHSRATPIALTTLIELSTALTALHPGAYPEDTLANVLSDLCANIQHSHVHPGWQFPDPDPDHGGVFILTRQGRLRGLQDMPFQSADGRWIMVFGLIIDTLPHIDHVQVSFRWSPAYHWQHTGTRANPRPASQMRFLVYVNTGALHQARRHVLEQCGGQIKITCLLHGGYLLRQQMGCAIACCTMSCKTGIRWRCPEGLGYIQCSVGLCMHHFRQAVHTAAGGTASIAVYGPEMRNPLHPQLLHDEHQDDYNPDMDEDNVLVAAHDADVDDIPCNPLERYGIGGNDYPTEECPTITSSSATACFLSDSSSTTTLGHYLLNNHLQVLNRSTKSQKAPVAAQKILQQICARTPEWTVPLLFPESQLFPRIFWCMHDHTVTGALPAIMFSNLGQYSKNLHVATLTDHMYVRLMDGSIPTSHDFSYLQFIFDVILNSVLNVNSATIACRKGLEHLTRNHSNRSMHARESILQLDELDARREVKQLSSLLRSEGPWDYFVTLTCNDSQTMGVWPIRAAIMRRSDPLTRHHMLQSYAVIMTRAWERTGRYIWKYIQYSPERPLGHVKVAWMRYEFQSSGALGNRPHIHGGVTLYPESKETTLQRIRCSMKDMFTSSAGTDMDTLLQEGLVASPEEFATLYCLANQLQTHSCANAASRCMKRRAADDSLICRVQRHPPSFVYTFNETEHLYDEETIQRLQYLDLGALDPITQQWKPHIEFRGGRWQYPAQPHEHFVPTNPRLFVAMRACTNVQCCDNKFQVSYLCKYAAGLDEKCQVTLTHSRSDPHTVNADVHEQMNMKITGQAIKASKKHVNALAREIPLTEMIWFSAGLPYVTYPAEITNVSTMPPEYRAAIVKHVSVHQRVEGGGGQLKPVETRRELPDWRQFTPNQELAMLDFARGTYCLDVTTGFSLRPPELVIFNNLEIYAKWFCFSPHKEYSAHQDIATCLWIDGACRRVRLRHAYVLAAAQYLLALRDHPDIVRAEHAQDLREAIFDHLRNEHTTHHAGEDFSDLYHRYVDATKTMPNVVVFTQVTPTQFSRFLVHLMLSMGTFVTEIDLYSAPSMIQAFRNAGLISHNNPTEEDVKCLAKRYVQEQLQWLAIGTRRFSRLLMCVIDGLQRFLLHGEITYDALPLYLQRTMVEHATDEVAQLLHSRRIMAVDTLYHELSPILLDFPNPEQLKVQQVVPYIPHITPAHGQSAASVAEQTALLQACHMAIDNLFQPTTTFIKSPLLVGPPGSGKTHILLIAQTYALSRGLNAQLVAMTSERARKLGGEHIHLLFGMPVLDNRRYTISSLSESTLFNLARSPIRLAALQRIDVLFIEEIGLVSAETFAVMDLVLRYIRDNPVPMGGILMIASGDPRQLPPVSGSPIWASYHVICTFQVNTLVHYVRAQTDANLQTILEILRRSHVTDAEMDMFEHIIRQHCIPIHCVPTWSDVPPHVLRVVGTRQASQQILNEFLAMKMADPHVHCVSFPAVDEIETPGGQVMNANQSTSHQLNMKCHEPSTLVVFVGAVMRLTYNNTNVTPTRPRFSQGQLCVVRTIIPPDYDIAHPSEISVQLVPAGVRQFQIDHLPADWCTFNVKVRATAPIVVGGQRTRAWRKQYPLHHFVSSTIHKAIGETLPHIATQLSLQHKQYRLWQREQLLVLMSRVPTLNDMTFVTTDPEDTLAAMLNILMQPSRWAAHIEQMLQALDCRHAAPRILHHELNPLPGQLQLIPDLHLGYVYLLVSCSDCRYGYVGETGSILRRVKEHNTGRGSRITNDPYLRPWTVMVLICGFPHSGQHPNNIAARKAFEAQWHRRNARLAEIDVRGIRATGHELFAIEKLQNPDLLWQEFATVQVRANE